MNTSTKACLLSGIFALLIGIGLCIGEAGGSIMVAVMPVMVGSFNLGWEICKLAQKADKKDSTHG